MPDDSGRRVDLGRAQLHQRRLAGTVGTEDHPALVVLDRPVDPVEQGGTASLDGDVGELEHGIHEWDLNGAFGVGWSRRQPTRPRAALGAGRAYASVVSSLPVAAVLATWLDAFRAGDVGPDDLADAVRGDDPRHLVSGLGDGDPIELHELPDAAGGTGLAGPARRRAIRWGWVVRPRSTSRRSTRGRPWSRAPSAWCPTRTRARSCGAPSRPTACRGSTSARRRSSCARP